MVLFALFTGRTSHASVNVGLVSRHLQNNSWYVNVVV